MGIFPVVVVVVATVVVAATIGHGDYYALTNKMLVPLGSTMDQSFFIQSYERLGHAHTQVEVHGKSLPFPIGRANVIEK